MAIVTVEMNTECVTVDDMDGVDRYLIKFWIPT
jgi:hypothetical protein